MSKYKQPLRPGIHLLTTPVTYFEGKRMGTHDEYYWHLVASNGRIIARSSETYTRKRNAINSIRVAANIFQFDFDGKYYENGEVKTMLV